MGLRTAPPMVRPMLDAVWAVIASAMPMEQLSGLQSAALSGS